MKTRSALSYFGSDSEVAEHLAGLLRHCKHVSIPFCGGCAILPHLSARAIVCNDTNSLAINFYRVLSECYGTAARQHLVTRCQYTLSHPAEIGWARALIDSHESSPRYDDTSRADLAWAYWALCWIGRKGQGGTKKVGSVASTRSKADGGNNATRIQSVVSDLESWAEEFKRCEWTQDDFRVALDRVADHSDCGVYCDPPWIGCGDSYLHSFTKQDHLELKQRLSVFCNTTVVVRYGDHEAIRSLYSDWHLIESWSRTQSNRSKKELWLTNKECDPNDARESA